VSSKRAKALREDIVGYDLHITRKEDWCDKDNDISLDE
jgi:hypothetical protein